MSKNFTPAPWPRKLRSQHWYGGTSRDTIYHRGWLKNQGYPHDLFDGRPVIGILNTWADLTPCNGHLRELAEKVKAGVWEAGGFPVEVPVFSACENTYPPDRDDVSQPCRLAVEEAMRGQPIDGAVLMVGCDKTTPSPADGRGLDRHSVHRRHRRADAERLVPGRARGLGHASVEILRGREGRRDDAGRIP